MASKRKIRKQRRGASLRMPTVSAEKKIDFPWAPKPLGETEAVKATA